MTALRISVIVPVIFFVPSSGAGVSLSAMPEPSKLKFTITAGLNAPRSSMYFSRQLRKSTLSLSGMATTLYC